MHDDDADIGFERAERGLQPNRLLERFLHERLERGLTKPADRVPTEPAAEALDPHESDVIDDRVLAVQDVDAAVAEHDSEFVDPPRLVIVVAEDSDDRDLDAGHLLDEDLKLLGSTLIGEIATENEDVRFLVGASEEIEDLAPRSPAGVEITDGGDLDR